MLSITFNADSHAYTVLGSPVPSVTQVLRDLVPGWSASDWHLHRGQAVHACAAMIAKGVEFESDPQISGQVQAIRKFFHDVKPLVIEVERVVFHGVYRYAGTFDLLTRHPFHDELMILDWKASLSPCVPYQLAAYAMARSDEDLNPIKWGCGVEIHQDGTYKMSKIHDLRRYKAGFLALLGAYNIRRECKIEEVQE